MRRRAARRRAALIAFAAAILPFASAAPAGAAKTAPFELLSISPRAGATSVSGQAPVILTFSRPVAPTGGLPSFTPAVPGSWRRTGDRLVFDPAGAFPPDTAVTVEIPGGPGGVRSRTGATLHHVARTFTTEGGSLLRAQQILAELDYLPARYPPAGPAPASPAALAAAIYRAPAVKLAADPWAPAPLRALLRPGVPNVLTRGALVSFQRVNGLAMTGNLDPPTWRLLARDAAEPSRHVQPGGYTYALADQRQPERLTVYAAGRVVVSAPVNTGIPAAPTADGSFLVYERLASQIMTGTTPWGSKYADPVSWVAYFNGGDAVHYIGRAAYGYPQSLGCIELPYTAAEQAWTFLRLGTVVTVEG